MDAMKLTTLKYVFVLLMFVNWLFCFYIFWEKISHDYSANQKKPSDKHVRHEHIE